MNKFLTFILVAAAAVFADVDRAITCGAMTALQPFGASAIVCPVSSTQQGIATGDTALFFKSGPSRGAYSTTEFSPVGGVDSIVCHITGVRRDADDVSTIYQLLYKYPGNTGLVAQPVAAGDTLTWGATVTTQRRAKALLPGLQFIPSMVVSTATDSMGVLGAHCYNK